MNLEERRNEVKKILYVYPDKIPIILMPFQPELKHIKKNFLISGKTLFGNFCLTMKNREIKIIDVHPTTTLMSEIYDKYKNEDYFLYFTFESIYIPSMFLLKEQLELFAKEGRIKINNEKFIFEDYNKLVTLKILEEQILIDLDTTSVISSFY